MMWPVTHKEVNARLELPEGSHDAFFRGVTTDSRQIMPEDLFIAIKGDKFDGHEFVLQSLRSGANAALVSRDWLATAKIQDTEILNKLIAVTDVQSAFRTLAQWFRRRCPAPVVAIGGSNGKTSTKEFLTAMLSGSERNVLKTLLSQNGFLGIPQTLMQRELCWKKHVDALVVEIGIDATGAMEQHVRLVEPDVVMLTALGAEHLEGLGSVENAIHEELLLYFKSPQSLRIVQLDDKEILARQDKVVRRSDVVVCCGKSFTTECDNILSYEVIEKGSHTSAVRAEWKGRQMVFGVPMPGEHNVRNFCLALACALAMGRTEREIHEGLTAFKQPPLRSNVVSLNSGGMILDDCYNANPLSMLSAFQSMKINDWKGLPKTLILGDMRELGAQEKELHFSLIEEIVALMPCQIALFGDVMPLLAENLRVRMPSCQIFCLGLESDPILFVKKLDLNSIKVGVTLVKGSRSMGLERLSQELINNFKSMT